MLDLGEDLSSNLASLDLSVNPVNEKQKRGENPYSAAWQIHFMYLLHFLMAIFPHPWCQHIEAFWKEPVDAM